MKLKLIAIFFLLPVIFACKTVNTKLEVYVPSDFVGWGAIVFLNDTNCKSSLDTLRIQINDDGLAFSNQCFPNSDVTNTHSFYLENSEETEKINDAYNTQLEQFVGDTLKKYGTCRFSSHLANQGNYKIFIFYLNKCEGEKSRSKMDTREYFLFEERLNNFILEQTKR